MATLSFQQTDAASVDAIGPFCSGRSATGATPQAREAKQGGTVGVGTPAVSLNGSGFNRQQILFESAASELNGLAVDSGKWTVPLNVTTAAGSAGTYTITEVWICRLNSSGVSQGTIGSLTGLSQSLDATGVITFSVTNGIGVTFATGERIAILLIGSNNDISAHTFNFTPNQIITSPPAVTLGNNFFLPVWQPYAPAPRPANRLLPQGGEPAVFPVLPAIPSVPPEVTSFAAWGGQKADDYGAGLADAHRRFQDFFLPNILPDVMNPAAAMPWALATQGPAQQRRRPANTGREHASNLVPILDSTAPPPQPPGGSGTENSLHVFAIYDRLFKSPVRRAENGGVVQTALNPYVMPWLDAAQEPPIRAPLRRLLEGGAPQPVYPIGPGLDPFWTAFIQPGQIGIRPQLLRALASSGGDAPFLPAGDPAYAALFQHPPVRFRTAQPLRLLDYGFPLLVQPSAAALDWFVQHPGPSLSRWPRAYLAPFAAEPPTWSGFLTQDLFLSCNAPTGRPQPVIRSSRNDQQETRPLLPDISTPGQFLVFDLAPSPYRMTPSVARLVMAQTDYPWYAIGIPVPGPYYLIMGQLYTAGAVVGLVSTD